MADRPVVTASLAAAAAREVADVLDLYGGAVGEIATYGGGERVGGVRVRGERLTLYLIVRFGRPLADIAEDVRDKVRQRLDGSWVIDVHIQDVRAEQVALERER